MIELNSTQTSPDVRLHKSSTWQKIGYASGDFSYNFMWYIVSALLLSFYTDVFLIPAATVSLFVLLVRLSDAVVDPIIGSIADRTRTRWGRYRPYILFGPFVMVMTMTLTFWAHPTWGSSAKVIYAVATFALATLASTFVNMPYGALNAVVSLDTDERVSFSSFRMVAAQLGNALVGFVVLPLVTFFKGTGEHPLVAGYVRTVPLLGIVSIVLFLVCFFSTHELIQPSKQAKPKLTSLWGSVLHNRPLLIVILGFFLFGCVGYGRAAVMVYFFQYNLSNLGLFSIFNLVSSGMAALGALLAPYAYRLVRSGNKGHMAVVLCAVQALIYCSMYLVSSPQDIVLFFILGGLGGTAFGMFISILYGMVPDTVEFGEFRTGLRSEGFNYAFTSLAFKWGGAAGPAVLGLVLAMTGYVPDIVQTAPVLHGISLMMTVVPGVLSLAIMIPFIFYKIDRGTFNSMVDEIERRGDWKITPTV